MSTRKEARISPRNRKLDRALQTPRRGIWRTTVVIFLIGLVVLVWTISPTERKRRSLVKRLPVGTDSAQVTQLLGPPVRCRAGSLEHLRGSFPEDWAPAAVERALEGMRRGTVERWIYPISLRRAISCGSAAKRTEVGVDRAGRVLWHIPVTGRDRLTIPDEFSPSAGGG